MKTDQLRSYPREELQSASQAVKDLWCNREDPRWSMRIRLSPGLFQLSRRNRLIVRYGNYYWDIKTECAVDD